MESIGIWILVAALGCPPVETSTTYLRQRHISEIYRASAVQWKELAMNRGDENVELKDKIIRLSIPETIIIERPEPPPWWQWPVVILGGVAIAIAGYELGRAVERR